MVDFVAEQETKKITNTPPSFPSIEIAPAEKLYKCENPKCSWPTENHKVEEMTQHLCPDGKLRNFCILECVQDYIRNVEKRDPRAYFPDSNKRNLPEGQWSRAYPDGCRECKTKERKHMGKGLCSKCYFIPALHNKHK